MNKLFLIKEWKEELSKILKTKDFQDLISFLEEEYKEKIVFPNKKDIFRAFNLTKLSDVSVVILGQDPYHGLGEADGLAFSISNAVHIPPSLKNIYKEIESDLNIKKDFNDGDLSRWSEQGVFLLNSIMTVLENNPSSHKNKGWEKFTDSVIKIISDKNNNVVFMLWGNYAKTKKYLIDKNKHLILEASHPSPFSAYNGFFDCRHFSKCNSYLRRNNKRGIIW